MHYQTISLSPRSGGGGGAVTIFLILYLGITLYEWAKFKEGKKPLWDFPSITLQYIFWFIV